MTVEAARQDEFGFGEKAERNFIGGKWKFTREGYEFDIYDPSDCSIIASIPLSTHRDIREAITAAQAALPLWTAVPPAERAAITCNALDYLEASIDLVASITSRDTGIPLRYAKEDILTVISEVREKLNGDISKYDNRAPGIIGQILSWSNPLVVSLRMLAVDLAHGNVAIVHPSIRAPLSVVCFADALSRAGAVGGVFNLIQGAGTDAGMALACRPELRRLDFQGSRQTVQMVALSPSRNGVPIQTLLRSIKTVNLPKTSDLAVAAHGIAEDCFCHAARAGFGGLQVCVPIEGLGLLAEQLQAKFRKVRYLDATRGAHSVAPYPAEKFRIAGEAAVEKYLEGGAQLLCEAPAPNERTFRMGWFARPRLLHDVSGAITLDPDMPNGPLVLLKSY